jgi:hypothetical protein
MLSGFQPDEVPQHGFLGVGDMLEADTSASYTSRAIACLFL